MLSVSGHPNYHLAKNNFLPRIFIKHKLYLPKDDFFKKRNRLLLLLEVTPLSNREMAFKCLLLISYTVYNRDYAGVVLWFLSGYAPHI